MEFEKYPLGFLEKSKKTYCLDLPINSSDLIVNNLILDFMGGGKTNLLTSIAYGQFKAFKESDAKRGTIPIIFSPKFEYMKIKIPSKDDNIAPELRPDGIDAIQITFPICNPPDYIIDLLDMRSIIFEDLSVEEIALLGGISPTNTELMSKIKLALDKLRAEFSPFGIEEFIDYIKNFTDLDEAGKKKKRGPDITQLYYHFSTYYEIGLFDNKKYPPFVWKDEIKKLKPVVINFGKMWDSQIQSLGGYMLRKLHEFGDWIYDNVRVKGEFIKGLKEMDLTFTEEEKFFGKYFYVSLLIDEAPKMLTYTTSSTLTNFPANKYFQVISSNEGRKLGFKYTYIVTQFFADMYHKFRRRYRFVWFGNRVTGEDRVYISDKQILSDEDIPLILNNKKFFFTVIDMNGYNNNKKHEAIRRKWVTKFMVYRSPCGVT